MVQRVRQKILKALLLIPVLFNLSGCVYLVVGGVGALGGYIVSPDTVEGISENDTQTVWDASVDVIAIMGVIQEQQQEAGFIKAQISRAQVTITIISINDTTTKISIKARKAFLPKISLAQDIYVKIMSYLNG
ncbi:MAG TPA: DUF3568 family protein [Candidatus Omnitrophota bacterium]|nr:DUF3568 family protein [Candidatus Omnitrophota bacterium]